MSGADLLPEDASGFVLAGGRSSRMGSDKALLTFAGRPLVRHALDLLSAAGLTAAIAGARSDLNTFAPVIADATSDLGPLSGVCSALSYARSAVSVFLPVDMPLIPASFLEYLVRHALTTGSAVTLASANGFVQTFPVVLRTDSAPRFRELLEAGERGCFSAFGTVAQDMHESLRIVPAEFVAQAGAVKRHPILGVSRWFTNLNNPDELQRAELLIA